MIWRRTSIYFFVLFLALPSLMTASEPRGQTKGATLYVASNGRDSNDGLNWKAAKRTLTAAWSALPSGGGDIYVSPSLFSWPGGAVPPNTRIHFQGEGGTITITGQVVLSHGDAIDCGRNGILKANFRSRPSSGAVIAVANASGIHLSCRIDADGNANVATGVAFRNDSGVVAPLIDVRGTGGYIGNAEYAVYIDGCTDCNFGIIRVRNHGANSTRMSGTNGVMIRGVNSHLVIGTVDVDGTTCQGGNGNINIQGSGVLIHQAISTNPRGPAGNLYGCDAFNITGSHDTVDYLWAYNGNAPRTGGGTVAIEPPASDDTFGTIVDNFSDGNGIEVNSSSNGHVDGIHIGNFVGRDAGMAGPKISNRAGIELVANAPNAATQQVVIGSAIVFDDLLNPDGNIRNKPATQYGIYLGQGNSGTLNGISVGPVTVFGLGGGKYHVVGAPTNYRFASLSSDTGTFNFPSDLPLEQANTLTPTISRSFAAATTTEIFRVQREMAARCATPSTATAPSRSSTPSPLWPATNVSFLHCGRSTFSVQYAPHTLRTE